LERVHTFSAFRALLREIAKSADFCRFMLKSVPLSAENLQKICAYGAHFRFLKKRKGRELFALPAI
jgi:hypothetical protein